MIHCFPDNILRFSGLVKTKTIYCILVAVSTLFSATSFGQVNGEDNQSPAGFPNNFVQDFTDPSYPIYPSTPEFHKSRFEGQESYDRELLKWSEKQEPFPKLVKTGNSQKDERKHDAAIAAWFDRNPFYPQPGYSNANNKEQAEEEYEEILKEWLAHFPEKHKEIRKAVALQENAKEEIISGNLDQQSVQKKHEEPSATIQEQHIKRIR